MADPNIQDPGKEPEKKSEEITPPAEPEPEPTVRRSAASHIIERKDKKIEELKKKVEGDEDEDTGSDEELTPEGRKAIDQAVERTTAPLRESISQQADEQELRQVLDSHADDEIKVPESVLRKYISHPGYKSVSIDFIYNGLQAEYQRRETAKKKAEEEARGGNLAGTSRRPANAGKLPDFSQMSDAEFAEWEKTQNRGE